MYPRAANCARGGDGIRGGTGGLFFKIQLGGAIIGGGGGWGGGSILLSSRPSRSVLFYILAFYVARQHLFS